MRFISSVLLIIISLSIGLAQEFNMKVTVEVPNNALIDAKVFQVLERQLNEFVNRTKWTDDVYEDYEKIEGTIAITVRKEISTNQFQADVRIQALRPVFKSNYKTQTVNLVDKNATINYEVNQLLRSDVDNYFNGLSSLISYYAYLILGYDYDSFAALGGTKHFESARRIVEVHPGFSGGGEWGVSGGFRGKYNIVNDLLQPRSKDFRLAFYEYHITALDIMHEEPEKAIAIMTSNLGTVNDLYNKANQSIAVQIFMDSKREEIVDIFKATTSAQKSRIYDYVTNIDPARSQSYKDLKN